MKDVAWAMFPTCRASRASLSWCVWRQKHAAFCWCVLQLFGQLHDMVSADFLKLSFKAEMPIAKSAELLMNTPQVRSLSPRLFFSMT
jgi:hypothetical protein